MKKRPPPASSAVSIDGVIHAIRGERVILDADLAAIYGVLTKVPNQAVKRNRRKFPGDFLFQLTLEEFAALDRPQGATGRPKGRLGMRSQIVTASKRNVRFMSYAFTENDAVMATNVLNSPEAVRMSVHAVRAFVQMRALLTGSPELAAKLRKLDASLTARLDNHEAAIIEVRQRIMLPLDPPPGPETPDKEMGCHTSLTKPAKR